MIQEERILDRKYKHRSTLMEVKFTDYYQAYSGISDNPVDIKTYTYFINQMFIIMFKLMYTEGMHLTLPNHGGDFFLKLRKQRNPAYKSSTIDGENDVSVVWEHVAGTKYLNKKFTKFKLRVWYRYFSRMQSRKIKDGYRSMIPLSPYPHRKFISPEW